MSEQNVKEVKIENLKLLSTSLFITNGYREKLRLIDCELVARNKENPDLDVWVTLSGLPEDAGSDLNVGSLYELSLVQTEENLTEAFEVIAVSIDEESEILHVELRKNDPLTHKYVSLTTTVSGMRMKLGEHYQMKLIAA